MVTKGGREGRLQADTSRQDSSSALSEETHCQYHSPGEAKAQSSRKEPGCWEGPASIPEAVPNPEFSHPLCPPL